MYQKKIVFLQERFCFSLRHTFFYFASKILQSSSQSLPYGIREECFNPRWITAVFAPSDKEWDKPNLPRLVAFNVALFGIVMRGPLKDLMSERQSLSSSRK